MDAGRVALSECDARESAAKVKVVSIGDAAGPAGLQSPCRLLMLAEARMVLTGEGGVEDRGGPTKVEELTCGVSTKDIWSFTPRISDQHQNCPKVRPLAGNRLCEEK